MSMFKHNKYDDDNMSFKQAEKPIVTASELAGLTPIQDDGHIILVCSNCGKELVDIWQTHKTMPQSMNLSARCCFCGDKSFTKTVDGFFHTGPANGVNIVDILTSDKDNSYIFITET